MSSIVLKSFSTVENAEGVHLAPFGGTPDCAHAFHFIYGAMSYVHANPDLGLRVVPIPNIVKWLDDIEALGIGSVVEHGAAGAICRSPADWVTELRSLGRRS